jgi:hypothetical protein
MCRKSNKKIQQQQLLAGGVPGQGVVMEGVKTTNMTPCRLNTPKLRQ